MFKLPLEMCLIGITKLCHIVAERQNRLTQDRIQYGLKAYDPGEGFRRDSHRILKDSGKMSLGIMQIVCQFMDSDRAMGLIDRIQDMFCQRIDLCKLQAGIKSRTEQGTAFF